MAKKTIFLIFIILVLITITAGAEDTRTYTVMPGDVLSIWIEGFPEYSNDSVRIMPDGKIQLRFGIELRVSGFTPSIIKEMISVEYSNYLRDPQVSVSVKEFQTITVRIVGQVRNPGSYTFERYFGSPRRVSDVVSTAGGTTDRADRSSIALIREEGANSNIRYFNMEDLEKGDASSDHRIADGDFIFVNEAIKQVLVVGEVEKPGSYEIKENTRVLDVIMMAGGLTGDGASKISHTREVDGEAEVTEIDLEVLIENTAHSSNILIQPGDMIVVPEERRITIEGTLTILNLIRVVKDLLFNW